MTPQAQLAMVAWIPIAIYLFIRFPVQKAVIIGFVGAWLFLPQRAGFSFPGFPDYNRISAASYSILLATCIFDVGRFQSFKLSWLDLPMLIWCVCPLASSLSNGLGLYDGLSSSLSQTVEWGFPYFLGRIYFNNFKGMRLLALGIFIGGLVYVPLCLYEIRMSPQLHGMVYGYLNSFGQSIRYGGYRPTLFMQHGLAVGLWMMAATLVGIWLWQAGVIKQLWGIPVSWLVPILLITFILCKSTGAWFLGVFGIIIMFAAKWLRTALPLLVLIGGIFFYQYYVATGLFTTQQQEQIISVMTELTSEERASSLKTRFDAEQLLGERARQRIIFGWGGWNRNRVYEYNWFGERRDVAPTDSLWIIAFGTRGLVGIFSLTASLLLPVIVLCGWRYPARLWFNPKVAPAVAVALVVTLYMADNLTNDMFNPVFPLASGGIAGLVLQGTDIPNKVRSSRASATKRTLAQSRQHQYD